MTYLIWSKRKACEHRTHARTHRQRVVCVCAWIFCVFSVIIIYAFFIRLFQLCVCVLV